MHLLHSSTTSTWALWLFDKFIPLWCFHEVAKFSATMNSKTSKHRIPLAPLWLNHSKPNQQRFQVLYVGITVSGLPPRFLGAMAVFVIGVIFPRQGQPSMKSTPCLSLKWRFLARIARPCLSSASHFFGLRIRPSWSEIFSRRRISRRISDVEKFLGRLGKIEGFFILYICKNKVIF
jgi:hypothetical protein